MLFLPLATLSAPDALAADDVLTSAWGSELPPATWVFVLESAGDAWPAAQAAREPIARLVEALPVGDRVEMLAVHTRTTPLLPPRVIADDTRAALAAEIRALEIPSAKSIDLGAALLEMDAVLDTTSSGGAVLLVYQGTLCHSPPLGSPWADGGFGCREVRGFERLKTAWQTPASHARLEANLFPVGDAPNKGGLAALSSLVEPAGTVQPRPDKLAAWVGAALETGLDRTRLRPLARAEAAGFALSARVVQAPRTEDPRAVIELGTGLEHLSFDARAITVEGARHSGGLVTLEPNATIELEVDVPRGPFSLVPRQDTVDIPVRIHLDGALAPTDALSAIGLRPELGRVSVDVALKAQRSYGLSAWRSVAMVVSALALGAGAALVTLRQLKPVRLGGAFYWRQAGGARHPLAIESLSEAPIVVRADGTLGTGRREDAAFVLIAERPLWKTHVYAEVLVPGVEINTRPAPVGRHALVAGAASFGFRDYRLSWE
jgi:hypothetical protein